MVMMLAVVVVVTKGQRVAHSDMYTVRDLAWRSSADSFVLGFA